MSTPQGLANRDELEYQKYPPTVSPGQSQPIPLPNYGQAALNSAESTSSSVPRSEHNISTHSSASAVAKASRKRTKTGCLSEDTFPQRYTSLFSILFYSVSLY